MPKKRILNQVGDTIVEVLIALVVVGLAIGLGYGVASRSLKTTRSAQERVEALKVVESQVERLKKRAAADADADPAGIFAEPERSFCMTGDNNQIVEIDTPPALAADTLSADAYAGCIDGLYYVSVTPEDAGGSAEQFKVTARWSGLVGNGKQESSVIYRVYPAPATP